MNAILTNLETELAQGGDYSGRAQEVVTAVKDHFLAVKSDEPTVTEMEDHYLTKPYFCLQLPIPENQSSISSRNELEEAFYECLDAALFYRHAQEPDRDTAYCEKAQELQNLLGGTFLADYYQLCQNLSGTDLLSKLKLDCRYEQINKEMERDRNSGYGLLGAALALADQLGDQKRESDLLSKSQYILYEYENLPHVALSLGQHLIAETADYQPLQTWVRFHNGNIFLDLDNVDSARQEYEPAFVLAEGNQFFYAIMVLRERLALVHRRLNQFDMAGAYYQQSLSALPLEFPKPWLKVKNQLRCLIGLGLIEVARAREQDEDQRQPFCERAENYYRQAAELAARIHDPVNQAVAFSNLGNLYRLMYGDTDPRAKRFHQLAYDINTNQLNLPPEVKRVQWDQQWM